MTEVETMPNPEEPETDAASASQGDPLPEEVARVAQVAAELREELARRIVGQEGVVELLLVALFSRGHGLFEGVPGLAKTLLIQSLAEASDCSFSRVQFTPDLLPADITGTEILEEDRTTGRRSLRFVEGPIFANLVLADEVNRTPPKTQAALLQAMQEGCVTFGGRTLPLPEPFLVFATQNPIEQEGTYPLPEAQLDRFMFRVKVDYPSAEEELAIVDRTTGSVAAALQPRISPQQLMEIQEQVRNVPAGPEIVRLAVELVRASRPGPDAADFVRDWVAWGAGPRASQFLILGGKARALMHGRFAVSREDIHALAQPVLGHRILVNFRAEAEGVDSASIIEQLLALVDAPTEL
ncbi:MAG: MoxR family ATPase [Myxococcota bacterium]|nr:MoxR family ATPase [Myxococcota bacterium]